MNYFKALALWLLLCACTVSTTKNLYEIKLLSGDALYSDSSPKLEGDYYHFDDLNNQKYIIQKRSVLYIQPTQFKR